MSEYPVVQIRVERRLAQWFTVVKVGGLEFFRPAENEGAAMLAAMEVQGSFEFRLNVEFHSTPEGENE